MNNMKGSNKVNKKDTASFNVSDYEGTHEISPEERQEILNSIEEALVREQKGSDGGTPLVDFGSVRPVVKRFSTPLPVWMNIGALLLLGVSSFVMWKFLGTRRSSESLVSTGIISTEGLIVERLREDTQAELDAKNRELEKIRKRLGVIESERLEIEEKIEGRLAILEEELLIESRRDSENERKRLIAAGVFGDQLQSDLADYEAAVRKEMELRLAESRVQLGNEFGGLIAELDAQRSVYENQVKNYNAELRRLTEEVANLESEIQSLAQSEASEARRTLEELQARRENEDGIRVQIAAYYEGIRNNWREGNTAAAIELLESLSSYLGEPGIRRSEAVRKDQNVNSFLIASLRRLIDLEENVNDMRVSAHEEAAFGPEDLELAKNEAFAAASRESRVLEERLSTLLLALDSLRNNYAALYNTASASNSESSTRIVYLLNDKLQIKSDLEPSAHTLLDTFVESTNALKIDKTREQMYGEFLGAIDGLILESKL